ncbi:MAG: SAM-dependent methyltransferase [Bacteroidales bacterium]|nr:SAM-dependent methyltransferase [Candidatus Cacconaster merdequi]
MSKLYLIPTPLGDYAPGEVLPAPVLELIPKIKLYFVEELRTARRFLSAAGLKGHIDELELHEINEHTSQQEIEQYASLLGTQDAGLISEAGLPAVADPGAQLVALAHRKGIEVVPQVGPSSLMLALMASGLNGQCFAFTGYLPAKKEERKAAVQNIEKTSARLSQTQIIIETPYRNDSLFEDMLSICRPTTRICIAADITLPDAFIKTATVAQWRKSRLQIGKRPCVFLLLGS